jgi:SAM-dependent methyltransferase
MNPRQTEQKSIQQRQSQILMLGTLFFVPPFILLVLIGTAFFLSTTNGEPITREVYCTRQKGYQYRPDGFVGFESAIAQELLKDRCGIEIGPSACNPFGVDTIHVGLIEEMDPIDYNHFKQGQINTCGDYARIDVPGDALDLHLFPDYSVDFVINSHVWEHVPNPLRALEEWVRVVRHGGIILVIVPHHCASPIDCARNLTTIQELERYYEMNANLEDFKEVAVRHRGHIIVFSPDLLMEITLWFNKRHQTLNDSLSLVLLTFKFRDDKFVNSNGHLIAWEVHKPV